MREAKVETSVISYSSGISAGARGEQWQRALSLPSEMWEAKVGPSDISYSSGISTCAKDEPWQRALSLLSGMWGV
eukprot:633730-Pyramimonas_sp.AAC.1